jgi:hypothetical protein
VQSRGVSATGVDFLQDRRRRREAQASAAVLFRDQHAQQAGLGHGGHEVGRIGLLAIEGAPIGRREVAAQGAHRLAQGLDQFGVH